ncbi:MAG: hypothetical protein AAF899_14190 [Pseudomonadota bacterium]
MALKSLMLSGCLAAMILVGPLSFDCAAATRSPEIAQPVPATPGRLSDADDVAVADDVLAAGMPAVPINAILLALTAVGLLVMSRRGQPGN